jgi:hypothetical protein
MKLLWTTDSSVCLVILVNYTDTENGEARYGATLDH